MSAWFPYVVYDATTGRIKRTGDASADNVALQAQDGDALIQASRQYRDDLYYVDLTKTPIAESSVAARPTPTIDKTSVPGDGATPVTLSNLPDPAIVSIDGTPSTVTGGATPIAFAYAASFTLAVAESFPYRPFSATVTAT